MFRKLFGELRVFFGGMIISIMMLMLCADKNIGGAEVNGLIGLALWLVLLWFMRNRSTFGAVIASLVIFFAVDLIKFGYSEIIGIEIAMTVVIIGAVYYMKATGR